MSNSPRNRKIVIQESTILKDEIGNERPAWNDFKRVYACIKNLSGREYWEAAQTKAEDTVDFTIEWHPCFETLEASHYRIKFNGCIYNIKSVDNIKFENKTIKIRAKFNGEKS